MKRIMVKYTRLCLNGGGVRGTLQVGALHAFSNFIGEPILSNVFVDGVYGISVGAFICTFVAFGFSITDMVSISKQMSVTKLLSEPRLETLLDISKHKGIDDGEKIHDMLRSEFAKKGMDFDNLVIGDALVPLHIIASDITRSKQVIFYEKIKVWDAIRASISLPMVYRPHTIRGRVFVDGAISCSHVMFTVPSEHRHTVLAIITANIDTRDIQNTDVFTFMNHVGSIRTNEVVRSLRKQYPLNMCMLVENDTSMLAIDPDKDGMLRTGYESCLLFLTECAAKEGTICR